MGKNIKRLEAEARKLEPSQEEREELTDKAVNYARQFLDQLREQNAFNTSQQMGRTIKQKKFSEAGTHLDELLALLKQYVDKPGLNPASGRHMGYIPGGGLYVSALADYLAAVSNRYAGIFFSSPGAVRIENMCIRWMCELVGFPENSSGNLTSGGSIANLIGLVTARDSAGLRSKDYGQAVIYTTRQVHHCVLKAVKFAGLADATLRTVEMDSRFRMRVEALDEQIRADKDEGLHPLVIFASAGTTDLGAVDPMDEICEVARKHGNIWVHVDAAYGGFFLLTDQGRDVMKGIDQADSVTIDPHKGLFLPYGSGAVLVKDGEKLFESQHLMANYLQDTLSATEEPSPADLSPELSKHFRGLRMWLPLQLFGISPFRAALKEKLKLATYFYQELGKINRIELGPQPELSVFFFRYMPETGDANAFNKKLIDSIHRDGRVFISSTNLDETIYLRAAVLNFRTHLEDIDLALEVIRNWIHELTKA